MKSSFHPRLAAPWMLLLAVGLLAAWLRYGLVQSDAMVQMCDGRVHSIWCDGRQWLVLGFLRNTYGIAALAATAWALMRRTPGNAWLAAALGAFALVLYCYESGALALLIGSLLLLRQQARLPLRLQPAN